MEYKRASEVLYKGQMKEGMIGTPETLPCFLTTAFVMKDLDELGDVTQKKGYTYIRKSNPNRTALAEKISYLEGSEDSLIFSSGMGAITTSLLTVLKPGDHVVCNSNIYGETYEVLTEILPKMNVSVSFVDLRDLAKATAALTPRTKLLYTEVLSNPTLTLADIEELSRMAHDAGALCMVDNTFTSPVSIRPLEWGVDLVVNSLTKFLNGHSDVMAGSVSARSDLVAQIHLAQQRAVRALVFVGHRHADAGGVAVRVPESGDVEPCVERGDEGEAEDDDPRRRHAQQTLEVALENEPYVAHGAPLLPGGGWCRRAIINDTLYVALRVV